LRPRRHRRLHAKQSLRLAVSLVHVGARPLSRFTFAGLHVRTRLRWRVLPVFTRDEPELRGHERSVLRKTTQAAARSSVASVCRGEHEPARHERRGTRRKLTAGGLVTSALPNRLSPEHFESWHAAGVLSSLDVEFAALV